jgi:type II secretory pathway component GspD/PulD (secretin)
VNASWSPIHIAGSLLGLLLTAAWAPVWGVDAAPAMPASTEAAETLGFELPDFAQTPAANDVTPPEVSTPAEASTVSATVATETTSSVASAVGAPTLVKDNPNDGLDVAPNTDIFTNRISVEDVAVTPQQKLCRQPLADIRFEEVPVRDALKYLAEAAGINYVLPEIDSDKISTSMRLPPFKALESIANNFGMGVYNEDNLWFIRKKDREKYYAKIYKLKNIHLGSSTSGTGTDRTDDDDDDDDDDSSDSSSSSSSSDSSDSSSSDSSSSNSGGDVVITTIEEILGTDANFGGTVGVSTSSTNSSSSSSSSSSNTDDANTSDYTYVSYDADANTLFVIATDTQQKWVEQYIDAIDEPVHNIAIEAMFLESSKNPTSTFGIDWSGASSMDVSMTGATESDSTTGDTIALGSLRHIRFPTDGLIETNTLSLSLAAFKQETDSQIASYPSVVTQNGREVKIETSQKIPLSAVSKEEKDSTGSTSTTTSITDLGYQTIGTTITITPRQINDKLVQLTVSIDISTEASDDADSTNRRATNNTTYSGVVNVPVGYTLAIGGLEHIQDTVTNSKLPVFGDIPLFGFLFKSSGKDYTKTHIFLFITPTVLTSDMPDNSFQHRSEGLSKDWIDRADANHRAWRRNVIDPEEDSQLRKANKGE